MPTLHWLIIPAFVVLMFAYEWLKTLHYNNGRWKFTTSNDGFFRAVLLRRKTLTDPDFIDFGKSDGKRVVRWGRFGKDLYSDEIVENKVEVEVPWSPIYPDLETLRRLVFYPWVEEKIARWEFNISPKRWTLWHGTWLYDSADGMTCGESFYAALPELIAEVREKLKQIKALPKLPRGWEKF